MQKPPVVNEPIFDYAPGDSARSVLEKRLKEMSAEKVQIPCRIGGKDVRTGTTRKVVMPHSHQETLAEFHLAGASELRLAAETALRAQPAWEATPWEKRVAIFEKAAELLAGPWRATLNAATMLGQSKSAYQAEIDSACELIDFLRFNAQFYREIQAIQPLSTPTIRNRSEYRALEGFVLAITPFNFTAIAGNLPAAPAMMGNVVVWKPSDTQMLSAYYTMKLFEEAGLPPGVINMVAADGPLTSEVLLPHEALAGVHFTGSTATFRSIWKGVGERIGSYRSYPRLVGETGGKDFVFAHPSADLAVLSTALVRGAFEYQGQKCSAASRAYIPRSLWPSLKQRMLDEIATIRMGDVRDFKNFMNAVIDERSFKKIQGYIDYAKASSEAKLLIGGKADASSGYFIEPTVFETTNPQFKTMCEEIFGPVLTVHVYEDAKMDEMLEICDRTSPYALTGGIIAQDPAAVARISQRLLHAAGNLYINDKPTGAVVGQQPFGGGRASGTNDKAGSLLNLIRWTSARTVKENLAPPKDYRYPFMG